MRITGVRRSVLRISRRNSSPFIPFILISERIRSGRDGDAAMSAKASEQEEKERQM